MLNLTNPPQTANKALDAYLDRIKHLPPTPTLMIQLIELFRQPDADVDEIVTILKRDPALSVEVLRRCNSPYFGLETPVMDIHEAIFRMGFYEVYQITVSLFGMKSMTMPIKVPGFSVESLRQHSSITAIAAGVLAMEIGESEGIAYTAGLLHDLGKLVLALAEREKYVAVLEECRRTGASLSATEKDWFGFSHNEVGAQLLQRWGVPVEVAVPALGHNDPAPEGEWRRFVMITNLASRLANYIHDDDKSIPFWRLPEVAAPTKLLELNKTQIEKWENMVRDKIKQLPAMLVE
jgi:putative nucleotidyltransferase with HDIG domain